MKIIKIYKNRPWEVNHWSVADRIGKSEKQLQIIPKVFQAYTNIYRNMYQINRWTTNPKVYPKYTNVYKRCIQICRRRYHLRRLRVAREIQFAEEISLLTSTVHVYQWE